MKKQTLIEAKKQSYRTEPRGLKTFSRNSLEPARIPARSIRTTQFTKTDLADDRAVASSKTAGKIGPVLRERARI